MCWNYATSTKLTLQIISRMVCVRCHRVDFHLFTFLCLCGMFLLVIPVRAASDMQLSVFGRRATGVKRYSSRHIAQVHGVCTTGARGRSQRARQPTLPNQLSLCRRTVDHAALCDRYLLEQIAHSVARRCKSFPGQCVSTFFTPSCISTAERMTL